MKNKQPLDSDVKQYSVFAPSDHHIMRGSIQNGLSLSLGRIKNRRSMIYMGNLVDAIAVCLMNPAVNKTFLLSDGEDVSTPQLIQYIAEVLGKPKRLFPVPEAWLRLPATLAGKSKEADRLLSLSLLCVDSSGIRQELDCEAPYSLREDLMETAVWFEAYKELPDG